MCKSFSALIWVEREVCVFLCCAELTKEEVSYSAMLIEREEKAACVFFFNSAIKKWGIIKGLSRSWASW